MYHATFQVDLLLTFDAAVVRIQNTDVHEFVEVEGQTTCSDAREVAPDDAAGL